MQRTGGHGRWFHFLIAWGFGLAIGGCGSDGGASNPVDAGPPDSGQTFVCGSATCTAGDEYCRRDLTSPCTARDGGCAVNEVVCSTGAGSGCAPAQAQCVAVPGCGPSCACIVAEQPCGAGTVAVECRAAGGGLEVQCPF